MLQRRSRPRWRLAGRVAVAWLYAHGAAVAGEAGAGAEFLVAQATTSVPQSPCEDPQFLALRSTALDSMSVREYEYFSRKDAECEAYRGLLLRRGESPAAGSIEAVGSPRSSETDKSETRTDGVGLSGGQVFGLFLVCGFVSFLVAGLVINAHSNHVVW